MYWFEGATSWRARAIVSAAIIAMTGSVSAAWGASGLGINAGAFASEQAPGKEHLRMQLAQASGGWQSDIQRSPAAVKATRLEIAQAGEQTILKIALSAPIASDVFTLSDPYRVIIDLPNVHFTAPDQSVGSARGLVSDFRYGLFGAGKGRVVLDTFGPVKVVRASSAPRADGAGVELNVVLVASDAAAFGRGTGAKRRQTEIAKSRVRAPNAAVGQGVPGGKRLKSQRHVIVIDPGHGGVDPGAVGRGRTLEKNVVLAVARRLRGELKRSRRYDVRMTRDRDVFVSLEDRVALSRGANADLFISLHADSLPDVPSARTVRGASVYTLSEKASDAQAKRLATKENASDVLAGLQARTDAGGDVVRGILIDLMKRETEAFSGVFSKTLVQRLKKSISMSRTPRKSAAFKVLRQTQSPSVLIELGYLSNAADEKLMSGPAWQTKVAKAISSAITAYFAQRTAIAP